MIRIYVSVEGATEREFCSTVLGPYLITKDASVTAIDIRGNVSLERACSEIRKLIHNCDITTTLYDLYGFKHRDNRTKEELENALKSEINNPERFIPYIQQYEFESLLFSDPDVTSAELGSAYISSELSRIITEAGGVENINDDFRTCPSRRIKGLFPFFDKKLHGPVICGEIGIDRIRQSCLGFNRWIESIEELIRKKLVNRPSIADM